MKKILYAVTIALIFLSSCSKTSTLPQAPGNTGGGTTDTITPPPPVVTGLKPQLSGLLYRDNIPTNVSSSYQSELDGFVVRATWKQLQPVAGGPIAPNIIDTAITYARQWNVAHPQQPWHIKIRLYSGALAPDWVKAQFGSVYLKDRVDSLIGSDNQVVKFWAPGFLNAYADLINKMAAKYDSIPEIEEVTTPALVTFSAEPLLRQAYVQNDVTYITNGYTAINDLAEEHQAIDLLKTWKHTRVSMCFSPYEYINNDETDSVSLSSTEGLIDYFVQTMGNQGILENNGLRDSTSVLASDFQVGGITYAMYQYMLNYHTTGGIGVMFQTEAGSDIGNLNSTISQGINFGAAAIELPDNFGTLISVTQLQALRPMLKSNAPVN